MKFRLSTIKGWEVDTQDGVIVYDDLVTHGAHIADLIFNARINTINHGLLTISDLPARLQARVIDVITEEFYAKSEKAI